MFLDAVDEENNSSSGHSSSGSTTDTTRTQSSKRQRIMEDTSNGAANIDTLLDAAAALKRPRRVSIDPGISCLLQAAASAKTERICPKPLEEELAQALTMRRRLAVLNWYKRLEELYNYKDVYGDCMVPQKFTPNPSLGVWVNKQRMEKKLYDRGLKSSMTPRKIDLLNDINFHWAKEKGQVSWDLKYAELKDFYDQHGHCNVPTKYVDNTALGRWISTQRAQAKEFQMGEPDTKMTQERYDLLCKLDFQFDRLSPNKNKEPYPDEAESGSVDDGSD